MTASAAGRGRPSIEVFPREIREGDLVVINGTGWPEGPVTVTIDGRMLTPHDALRGSQTGLAVSPDARGDFVVQLAARDVPPGTREVVAAGDVHKVTATTTVEVAARSQLGPDGRPDDAPYWRARDFFDRRFGLIGSVPPGIRDVQMGVVRHLRAEKIKSENARRAGLRSGDGPAPAEPVPDLGRWTPMGPSPVPHGQTEGSPRQAVAGRVLAIAIDPSPPKAPGGAHQTVYIGTAGGGVWRTTDGGATWSPKTDNQISLAIGALAIDPVHPNRVLAGTGEFQSSVYGGLSYYGKGVLRSEDGGETWAEHTEGFDRHEISRIVFDPGDTTGERVYLSASNGVFESLECGKSWHPLLSESVSDMVAVVPAGSPGRLTLIAGVYGKGLMTSTRDEGRWDPWTPITDTALPAFPGAFDRIALGQCAGTPQTIYALFASTTVGFVRVARTTDGGSAWSQVIVRLNRDASSQDGLTEASAVLGHRHKFTVPAADLIGAPSAHVYQTGTSAPAPHTHRFTLSAAQIAALAGGTSIHVTTDADPTGHQHSIIAVTTKQCGYNLHISVRPDNPNVVYLGEVQLWRSTTGGGVFELITDGSGPPPPSPQFGIHTDQHAFAFDPTHPTIVWAGNDGGIYRSADGGNTWLHRNRDLQTLQYMTVSPHPTWEAIMIGGTQDNGTHRYTGHPAWLFSAYGDGGFTQIDPAMPSRMYRGYIRNTVFRSDSFAAFGTWVDKSAGLVGTVQFYPPFVLDPSDPNVCYFGNQRLWRSANNADEWAAISIPLIGNITAIAVHPGDSTTVYAGTTLGRVYQVRPTDPDWQLANVETIDLTAAPLPASGCVSAIVIDTTGVLWVTFSSVGQSEQPGDFTVDHVFRRAATGAWQARVAGLARANPINTIVIDPDNDGRLFVGADLGVFRTEDAGLNWTPWDEGLPNVPVFDLRIGPLRLLRAATHGRGVWERPIDPGVGAPVDLYIRDNILDTGRKIPSYHDVPNPFDLRMTVQHGQSPDIKVDAPDPAYQTAAPVDDYVFFEADLRHESARRTVPNRFYAQIHNRGPERATQVRVRAFFAFASAATGPPPLPADFWMSGKPFEGDPTGHDWTPIGETFDIPQLEPAEPGVAHWEWTVPDEAPNQSCLLVVTTCAEDPVNRDAVLDAASLIGGSKHVALKYLDVGNAALGPTQLR